MVVTRNWLNEWIDISGVSNELLLKTLNSIGLEVDSFKEVRIPSNIVVGYVKSRSKHENSDHLNVCEVDVGKEILTIVCGASNVEPGQFVPVAMVGAIMPNKMEIKKAKLRGVESMGMICSSTELGMPKINDGIMPLDASIGELKLGEELKNYPLLNDDIIEIDLTANRGDCLSIYGVARDLSAALDIALKEVELYEDGENLLGIGRILSIKTDEKPISNFQYKAIKLNGDIEEKLLLKLRLAYIGMQKTDIIQKIISYATHTTGVLFRAYDFDKIANGREKISLDIIKDSTTASVVKAENEKLSIAGIYQNDIAMPDENSKVIIIEANYTDPNLISRIVYENKNIKSDEHLYRSSRGSEPDLEFGFGYLFKCFNKFDFISIYAGSQYINNEISQKMVTINITEQSSMIGIQIEKNEALKILKKLGFDVSSSAEQKFLNVKIPSFRHDIDNSHDICEEIVRILGVDNIVSKPLEFKEKNRLNSVFYNYANIKSIKNRAVDNGFFECMHYVFDNKEELLKLGFKECKLKLTNPINNELNMLRPTLINHLLNSASRNIKNQKKSVRLFELGEVFDENANQNLSLAFLISGLNSEPSLLNGPKGEDISFLRFATKVQNCIGNIEIKISDDLVFLNKFEQGKIYQKGIQIGYIGRLDLAIEQKMDLPKTYICEIEFNKLKFEKIIAKEYSKMPSISRDLSLVVPNSMRYEDIKNCISSLNIQDLKEFMPIDIYKDKNLNDNFSLSIKFVFQNIENTLKDDEIADKMQVILDSLKDKLNLEIR